MLLYEKEIRLLNNYKLQINNLNFEISRNLVSKDEADKIIDMTRKMEFRLKKELINSVHVKANGEPRLIRYKPYKDRWWTKLEDGTEITANTEEQLIDKLFELYHLTLNDTSLGNIFEMALESRSVTDNYNHSTVTGYRSAFKRYILPELAEKEIALITREDLGAHTQKIIAKYNENGKVLTKKQFLKYKGCLNLIFRYAIEKQLISENPLLYLRNQPFMKDLDTSRAKAEDKIFSPTEIDMIKKRIRHYMEFKRYPDGYFVHGFGMLLAIETGMRCGELCSLKWEDVKNGYLHIHSQQVIEKRNSPDDEKYVERSTTKNERGDSSDGRYFPITENIARLLGEIQRKQKSLGINSVYVLAKADGEPIKTNGYQTSLRRLCKSLGFNITSNHAFRMSLNSNVLIPAGIPVTTRAKWLGQTTETNLGSYSFAEIDENENYLEILNKKLRE